MLTLIFDIDGTLINSESVVFPALRSAISNFSDQPSPSDETLGKTFGLPDSKIWEMLLPDASEETRQSAYRLSEQLICEGMFQEKVLLPDVLSVLPVLKDMGHTLTTASNCGVEYLDAVLDSQALRPYFTNPLCLGSVHGQKKADILTAHFQRFPKFGAVMIGDRSSDIEAAALHEIPSIGCSFGFGNTEELRDATRIIYGFRDILTLIEDSSLFFPHGRR